MARFELTAVTCMSKLYACVCLVLAVVMLYMSDPRTFAKHGDRFQPIRVRLKALNLRWVFSLSFSRTPSDARLEVLLGTRDELVERLAADLARLLGE